MSIWGNVILPQKDGFIYGAKEPGVPCLWFNTAGAEVPADQDVTHGMLLYRDADDVLHPLYPMTTMAAVYGLDNRLENLAKENKDYVDGRATTEKAEAKAYMDAAVRKAAPRNLLDNSDWRKPSGIVNQRGETTYSGNKYTIDRWRTYSGKATVTIGSGYLEITNSLMQLLDIDPDMVYTAAVCKADGSVVLTSGTFRAGFGNSSLGIRCSYTNSLCRFLMEPSLGNVAWAALYEGEYTAETLPEYQPKGYWAELAECQRYFMRRKCTRECIAITGNNQFSYDIRCNMRVQPSVVLIEGAKWVRVDGAQITISSQSVEILSFNSDVLCVAVTVSDTPFANFTSRAGYQGGMTVDLIADL